MLGPLLLLFLAITLWLDEWLGRQPVPAWLTGVLPSTWKTLPPGLAILFLGLVVVVPAARELAAIFKAGGIKASRRWLGIAAAAGLLISAFVPAATSPVHAVALVSTGGTAILVCALLWHVRGKTLQGATAAAGSALFA
jgi:hypothetical protein